MILKESMPCVSPPNKARLSASVGRPNYLRRIHAHRRSSMLIALASPGIASTLDEG